MQPAKFKFEIDKEIKFVQLDFSNLFFLRNRSIGGKNECVEKKLKVRSFGLLSGVGQAALNFNWLSLACLAN